MINEYLKWNESAHITLYIQKRISGFDAPKYKMIIIDDVTGFTELTDIFINWYPNKQVLAIQLPGVTARGTSPRIYLAISTTHGYSTLLDSTEKEFLTALEMI